MIETTQITVVTEDGLITKSVTGENSYVHVKEMMEKVFDRNGLKFTDSDGITHYINMKMVRHIMIRRGAG